MEELIEKLGIWRAGMVGKGLRVNLGKTKVMKCCEGGRSKRKVRKIPLLSLRKGGWYELDPMHFVHVLDS